MPEITIFNNSDLFLCQDAACAIFAANKAIEENAYVVAWQTYHFYKDPYIAVYYHRVYDLLSDLPVYHIIFDANNEPDGMAFISSSLTYLHSHTIFIALQDSTVLFDTCTLAQIRHQQQYPPPVLFHLNQEYPWNKSISVGMHNNRTRCSVGDLHAVYGAYGAVLRNYYHSSLTPPAHFLTLGPVVTDLFTRAKEERGVPLVSHRKIWCLFAGRVEYREASPYHQQRNEMLTTYNTYQHADASRQCSIIYDNSGQDGHTWTLDEYISEMLSSVFVLCPAGNNPETFRHYEAMDLGAIPIFLSPPEDVNFLQFWHGYPGPIFTNWDEAFEYIFTADSTAVEALQYDIYVWYVQHKQQQKQMVANIIRSALPIQTTNAAAATAPAAAVSDTSKLHEMEVQIHVLQDMIRNLELRVRALEKMEIVVDASSSGT